MSSLNEKILLSFDLDFTLIDNRQGILNSFNHALKQYSLKQVGDDIILKMIGMPLKDMFDSISPEQTPTLIKAFREYYGSEGLFQVSLIPKARETLLKLKKDGYTLGVITSKKEEMAIKLLEHLELSRLFHYIKGESDMMKNKTDPNLIRFISNQFSNHEIIIVGDHPNDASLAKALKCHFIGVLTGQFDEVSLKNHLSEGISYLILNNMSEITSEVIRSLVK